jgi:hypothetical protein
MSRFFQGNGPNRDRDGAKNKQRNGLIVTVMVAIIQNRIGLLTMYSSYAVTDFNLISL